MTTLDMITRARSVAKVGSTCLRRNVGAIVVEENGRNYALGSNRSEHDCRKTGCIRQEKNIPSGERLDLCNAIHAEVNAIKRAKTLGLELKGAHIHVTCQPCNDCAKAIIESGIASVTYCEEYPNSDSMELFEQAGVIAYKVGE